MAIHQERGTICLSVAYVDASRRSAGADSPGAETEVSRIGIFEAVDFEGGLMSSERVEA